MEIGGISMGGMGFNLDSSNGAGGSGLDIESYLEDLPSVEQLVDRQEKFEQADDDEGFDCPCCINHDAGRQINTEMGNSSISVDVG